MRAAILGCWSTLAVLGCGSPPATELDAAVPDCTGDERRCVGLELQACQGGAFARVETCGFACAADAGCQACDPNGGDVCDGADVVTCTADGQRGDVVETCPEGLACTDGACTRTCTADGVDLIYVVDSSYRLLSFDPRLVGGATDPFTLIGEINCPGAGEPVPGWFGGIAPFSMAVDRDARAWVLFTSGQIFWVSTVDATCFPSDFVPRQQGMDLFGMGFVTEVAGGNSEQLFLGGGDPAATPGGDLAVLDVDLAVNLRGTLRADSEYSPELTGTGAAELFGFFPGINTAFVQQIDRTTGAGVGTEYAIPGGLGGVPGTFVQGWAFAQWGGKFYLFVTTSDGLVSNSTVRTIDRATGTTTVVLADLPYIIVGAGVSTCAPTMIE